MSERNPLAGGEIGQRFKQLTIRPVALADNLAECATSRNWWHQYVE
jgi:hypothetical protein